MKIEIGKAIYEQSEKGDWIWKAKTPIIRAPKARHIADKPHHIALKEAIEEEEEEYQKVIKNTVKEIAEYLKTLTNDNQ